MINPVLIANPREPITPQLQHVFCDCRLLPAEDICCGRASADFQKGTSYVYLPSAIDKDGMLPALEEAKRVFQYVAQTGGTHFVLISSALIYGTGPGRTGMVDENYLAPACDVQSICQAWKSLESLASKHLADKIALTILRICPVAGSSVFPGRLFSQKFPLTLPGHDPVLQLLSPADLATAVLRILEQRATGTFNVAPETVVPLHKAIRAMKALRLPVPRTLQKIVHTSESLDFLRYSWTISGDKVRTRLGFVPRHSSSAALLQLSRGKDVPEANGAELDPFGMSKDYIGFYGKTLFTFLSDCYWRIEDQGAEHIPAHGPAVMVGMHRGFMPWDGVMALHTVVRRTGRYPRFLTHPALLKFPFLANFMTKLGGVVACQESADRVLGNQELLGIFPEGIHGAFSLYQNAYKLQAFGRDAFVKLALRHRAPIVPFMTVGSAEIFPILGKIKSQRWTRYSGWPFIPITPTFPLLPVPLPSKWHTRFLSPIRTDHYSPKAAEDRALVKSISREVRSRMQQALDDMLARRKSIFFGTIFDRRSNEGQSKSVPV